MIIHDLSPMGKCSSTHGGSYGIQSGPEAFQNFPGDYSGPRNECGSISKETLILVTVYVEETNCRVDYQTRGQEMSNPEKKVNDVLAHNVIYEKDPLTFIDMSRQYCPEETPINVFLLFSRR